MNMFQEYLVSFLQLSKYQEALEFALAAQYLDPSNSSVAEKVESLQKHIAAGM